MKILVLTLLIISACCVASSGPVLNFVNSADYANCNKACKGKNVDWRNYRGKDNRGMCAVKDQMRKFGQVMKDNDMEGCYIEEDGNRDECTVYTKGQYDCVCYSVETDTSPSTEGVWKDLDATTCTTWAPGVLTTGETNKATICKFTNKKSKVRYGTIFEDGVCSYSSRSNKPVNGDIAHHCAKHNKDKEDIKALCLED